MSEYSVRDEIEWWNLFCTLFFASAMMTLASGGMAVVLSKSGTNEILKLTYIATSILSAAGLAAGSRANALRRQ